MITTETTITITTTIIITKTITTEITITTDKIPSLIIRNYCFKMQNGNKFTKCAFVTVL